MNKKTIAVLYEYFYPGYKAGGPIQSLVNMIVTLQDQFNFKVITTAFDLNQTTPYTNIQTSCWNTIQLSSDSAPIQVWYAATPKISMGKMQEVLKEANADIVFINGLFTQLFSFPLLLKRMGKLKNTQIIISPRGMLQNGALQVKPLKKKVFLQLFKTANIFNNIQWHATTTDELLDIQHIINSKAKITVAANVPKKPIQQITMLPKQEGELTLVYLSIITEKKNLLQLIQALKKVTANIVLDIYGPIKEQFYWELCKQQIELLPKHIQVHYKGDLQPQFVQQVLQQYHAFISLTKGENFGHALYESLSAGRPMITSHFTPWNNLEAKQAGWNTSIENDETIALVLQQIASMNNTNFEVFYRGAWQLANEYYNNSNFINNYCKLFA